MRWWLTAPVVVAGCVARVGGAPCDGLDTDLDGRCDDPCPLDARDDADGDGVCGDVDACEGHDDGVDDDDDGVPDGCDDCPGDAGNDTDGDEVCAADDPCPASADDDCTVSLLFGVQVDVFPEDATWQVLDHRSSLLASGAFTRAGEGAFHAIEVLATRQTCVLVKDVEGDGGVRGLVFSPDRGVRHAAWAFDDYGSQQTRCFDPREGEPFTPPVERVWTKEGACAVELRVQAGDFPREVGWALERGDGRTILSSGIGDTVVVGALDTRPLTLVDGDYVFRMLDGQGDGWARDGADFSIRLDDGATLAAGALSDGGEGTVTFSLDCG